MPPQVAIAGPHLGPAPVSNPDTAIVRDTSLASPGHRVAGVVVGHVRGVHHQLQVIQMVPVITLQFLIAT